MGTTDELFGQEEADKANPPAEQQVTEAEQTSQEATAEPDTQVEEAAAPQPYTEDEFLALDFLQMEPERLTPSQMKVYKKAKQVDAEATKKFMEASEIQKQIKSEVEKATKPKTVFDFFDENPEETLTRVNQYISQKKFEEKNHRSMGNDAEAELARNEIDTWLDIKEQMRDRGYLTLREKQMRQEEAERLKNEVPDIEKQTKMAKEYMQEHGYSENLIKKNLADIEQVKHLAEMAKQDKAKVTAQSKITRSAPSKLGTPGSSHPESSTPAFDYKAEFEKAKKTGEWGKILAYKDGLLGG